MDVLYLRVKKIWNWVGVYAFVPCILIVFLLSRTEGTGGLVSVAVFLNVFWLFVAFLAFPFGLIVSAMYFSKFPIDWAQKTGDFSLYLALILTTVFGTLQWNLAVPKFLKHKSSRTHRNFWLIWFLLLLLSFALVIFALWRA